MKNRIKNVAVPKTPNVMQVENASNKAIWLRTTNLDDTQGLRRISKGVNNTLQAGKPMGSAGE